MDKRKNKISEDAVKKATGKTLEEWFKIINREGGEKMTHKEIARMLYDKKILRSGWPAGRSLKSEGWWCQMVTVQYEYASGRRITGETKDAGFEIGVQKTLPISPKEAWGLLTSNEGVKIWLNPTSPLASIGAGTKFKTKDGRAGEIRTYDEGKKIRLKVGDTTVQVYVLPAGQYYLNKNSKIDKSVKTTAIHFHQEKLKNAKEREEMRKHWKQVIDKLSKIK